MGVFISYNRAGANEFPRDIEEGFIKLKWDTN